MRVSVLRVVFLCFWYALFVNGYLNGTAPRLIRSNSLPHWVCCCLKPAAKLGSVVFLGRTGKSTAYQIAGAEDATVSL
ncbi:hypothetical protein DPEC_G00326020 [Dallia pectoralis]|uniref:Uncharacterized protein n=1 Tax=Dallia pectoralis TaxID=75939 RepID=A0ACC2F7R7_DALPE|nr:hypothetical protein DPEC_G00326020 [Dallia pectoralis]